MNTIIHSHVRCNNFRNSHKRPSIDLCTMVETGSNTWLLSSALKNAKTDMCAVDRKVAEITRNTLDGSGKTVLRSGAKGGLATGSTVLWSLWVVWPHSKEELGTGLSETPSFSAHWASVWILSWVGLLKKFSSVCINWERARQFLKLFQQYLIDCSVETLTRFTCSVESTIEYLMLKFPGSYGLQGVNLWGLWMYIGQTSRALWSTWWAKVLFVEH